MADSEIIQAYARDGYRWAEIIAALIRDSQVQAAEGLESEHLAHHLRVLAGAVQSDPKVARAYRFGLSAVQFALEEERAYDSDN